MFKGLLNIKLVWYLAVIGSVVGVGFLGDTPVANVARAAVALILTLYLIKNGRKLDLFDAFLILFNTYVVAISFFMENLTFGILYASVILAELPIFIRGELRKSNTLLKSIYITYVTLVLINFVTMLAPLSTDYGDIRYFLGGKNALAMTLIPAMFFISYYSYVKYKKVSARNLLFLILIIISLFIGGSATAIVVALVALIFILFVNKIHIHPTIYIISYGLIQLVMFMPRILSEIPYVSDFVTGYLGKDLTFTGRSNIWDVSISNISSSFFGYGKGNGIITEHFPLIVEYTHVSHLETHNMSLEILLTGGVILFLLFVVIVFGAFSFKKGAANAQLVNLSYFYVFAFFVIGLVENVGFRIDLWIMFAVIISTNNIINNSNQAETKKAGRSTTEFVPTNNGDYVSKKHHGSRAVAIGENLRRISTNLRVACLISKGGV